MGVVFENTLNVLRYGTVLGDPKRSSENPLKLSVLLVNHTFRD